MRAFAPISLFAGLIVAAAVAPDVLVAQDVEELGRRHGVTPPPGYYEVLARDPTAYQFRQVWKDIARQVSERRRALARAGDWDGLNAHLANGPSRAVASAQGVAVSGTFRFPVITGVFLDSTHSFLPDTAGLNAKLFTTGAAPPSCSPASIACKRRWTRSSTRRWTR